VSQERSHPGHRRRDRTVVDDPFATLPDVALFVVTVLHGAWEKDKLQDVAHMLLDHELRHDDEARL
jgi:hypothetical protein